MSAKPHRPRAPRPLSAAEWASGMERRSLASPGALVKQGRAHWQATKADRQLQARLAREICETRAADLTLAYRNLVWVVAGFRKRRSGASHRMTNELCVVFVVRRKGSVDPAHAQCLPRWLLTYAEHEGQRKLFAVPTDVQDVRDYSCGTAQARSGIWVDRPPWADSPGSFTCLVQLRSPSETRDCVMSAQHVFSPRADADSLQIDADLPVLPLATGGVPMSSPELARTLPYGGVLRGDERPDRPSFDVQLAAANDAVRDRVALRRFNSSRPIARDEDDLVLLDAQKPRAFQLLTPDNHKRGARGAIGLTLRVLPSHTDVIEIPYVLSRGDKAVDCKVLHEQLIVFETAAGAAAPMVPLPGDSGSPIVVRYADGSMTLVAMHIGGRGAVSWAIPAWRLFNLQFWRRYPFDAELLPLDA